MKQIKSIHPGRRPQTVIVGFTDSGFLPLSVDDIVKHKYSRGQTLGLVAYRRLVRLSLRFQLLSYCLRRLAASPQNRQLLSRHLHRQAKKIISKYHLTVTDISQKKIIHRLLSYLSTQNLLNHTEYIKFFIRKNQKKSLRYLSYQLQKLGYKPADFQPYLPPDSSKIQALIQAKIRHGTDIRDKNSLNKLIMALLRQGFTYGEVKNAIDSLAKNR